MQSNIYNIYLITAKQAGNNIRRAVCVENGFPDISAVSVKFHGKDQLVELVDNIMRYSKADAVMRYEGSANKLLDVKSRDAILHKIAIGTTFVESILHSKDARNCQKQLIDYMMAEIYLKEAFQYDKEHHLSGKDSATERAKMILMNLYSLNFISNFIFDGNIPVLSSNMKEQLMDRAFDPMYACTTLEKITALADKKYIRDFTSRKDFFSADTATVQQEMHRRVMESRIDRVDPPVIKQRRHRVMNRHPRPSFGKDLYQNLFVKLPTQKRRRKFLNLQQRHADILECGRSALAYKKQYATIDYGTKHNYINSYYADDYRDDQGMDKSKYYFVRENQMYGYIWNTGSPVTYKNHMLYFPDGAVAEVAQDTEPYEVLHLINAVYAALFGFSAEDITDVKDWMFNSVRSAYTDEGNAYFRMQMIAAREQGRM